MEAIRTSETSVYSNDTTRRYVLERCKLQLIASLRYLTILVQKRQLSYYMLKYKYN